MDELAAQECTLPLLRNALNTVYPITDEAWQDLRTCFSTCRLEPGDFFLRAGDQAHVLAFIVSGVMREFFTTSDGKEFNKSFVTSGMFSGSLMDLLSQQACTASIQALASTQLLVANYKECLQLSDKHSCVERFARKFAEQLFVKKARREYELMCLDATQRYINFVTAQPEIETQIAQYHIAGYLGITPVSLSRIRKNLVEQGTLPPPIEGQ